MSETVTKEQWETFDELGYVNLGKLLSDQELNELQTEIDNIMLGKADLDYSRLYMQLDTTTGRYEDAGMGGRGFLGATLAYRKIQDLEIDPIFLKYTERPIFADICKRIYGGTTPIACFRAMFMNKPAHQGTLLPWHQDAWTYLDRQPVITLWTALDPATKANGCVQVIPGSHKLGRVNPSHGSGFLAAEHIEKYCDPAKTVYIELEPGEVVLLHNYLMHRSDVNATDIARRAFSVCYMDGNTITNNGAAFTPLFEARPAELAGVA